MCQGTMLAWCSMWVSTMVSPAFRLERPQAWATRFVAPRLDDVPSHKDMHDVRREIAQDALVVRDEQHAHLRALPAHLVDPVSDDLQGVDVEPGIGLVEDGHVGFEQGHLQHLGALL